ncbi:putative caspase-8 [Apostichopus japonicus]|uniref:Putative caspase-8 n=1 Tax=Stichopus japonicus TaxID=307972 RepID=A0A2G8JPU8_STIJA|nr:putative caspase-8 [Apostichopus japonicus]
MNLISSFAFQGKPSTAKLAKEDCSKAYQPEETHKLQLESEQDTSSEDSLLTPEKLSATSNGFEIGSLAASVENMDISMNIAASGDMEQAELSTSMESAKPGLSVENMDISMNIAASGDMEQAELSISLESAKTGLKSSDLNMTVRSENTQKAINEIKSTPNESKVFRPPDSEERYSMDQIPRGLCLILTYNFEGTPKARRGNEYDREMLKDLFENVLKFDVVEKCNLTHAQTEDEIEQMAQKAYGDCFICFVCSHGDGESFDTSDDEKFKIQKLFTPFKPLNCKALAGKPKIFFINTCLRSSGVEFQHFKVVKSDDENELAADGEDGPESMGLTAKLSKLWADEGDFCVCLSTVPGYSSARQPKRGTIYVQHLYKCFNEKYMSEHLCDILTSVRRSTNQALKAEALKAEALKAEKKENDQKVPDPETVSVCQVSPAITGLMKKVYFTSGNTKT